MNILATSFGAALIVPLITLGQFYDGSCGTDRYGVPLPCSDGGGVGYHYDSNTRTFYPRPQSGEGSESDGGGIVWLVRYVVRCGINDPERPVDDLCVEATCEANGYFGYHAQVFRRQSAQDDWEPWPGRENVCWTYTELADPIPLEDVEAEIIAIIEEHYEQIARPEIDVAPAVNAVVNLPVIASTDETGPVGFDIENPLPGSVVAEPAYSWSWSNGSTGSGPGKSYDGTDPIAHPEHYPVHATYSRAGGGQVSLTTTWSITLDVDGIPPITDIEPLVYETTETFTVRSARTVLVD